MTLEKAFAVRQKRTGKTFREQYMLITYLYYFLGETPSIPRMLADIKDGYLTIILGSDQKFYFYYLDEADAKEAAISMDGYIISDMTFIKKVDFTKAEDSLHEVNRR